MEGNYEPKVVEKYFGNLWLTSLFFVWILAIYASHTGFKSKRAKLFSYFAVVFSFLGFIYFITFENFY